MKTLKISDETHGKLKGLNYFVEFAGNWQGNALILVYSFASEIPFPRKPQLKSNQF
jgi:hypothetical protein